MPHNPGGGWLKAFQEGSDQMIRDDHGLNLIKKKEGGQKIERKFKNLQ